MVFSSGKYQQISGEKFNNITNNRLIDNYLSIFMAIQNKIEAYKLAIYTNGQNEGVSV